MTTTSPSILQLVCHPVNDSNAPPPPSSSTRASSRKNRVYVMREFLLQTYPNLFCSTTTTTTTVLDVAGGKGDLSWLLCNFNNNNGNSAVHSIVVDPRPRTNHTHILKSIQYLKDHPDELKERAIPHRPTHQPLAKLLNDDGKKKNTPYRSPLHLRLLVNNDLVQAVRDYLENGKHNNNMEAWRDFWKRAMDKTAHETGVPSAQEEESTTTTMLDADCALQLLLQTNLVVGFHPDQATEACIDLALLLHVPYCVVPCCVFPSEFPHRKTPENTRVRCYDEFVEYL